MQPHVGLQVLRGRLLSQFQSSILLVLKVCLVSQAGVEALVWVPVLSERQIRALPAGWAGPLELE